MNERRESINELIEQSSLGTPDARAARATVSRAVARRIVAASTNTNLASTYRSAVTARWVSKKRQRRTEG